MPPYSRMGAHVSHTKQRRTRFVGGNDFFTKNFVRNVIIIGKKPGKTVSKAVSTRAPATRGITASIAKPISWK